MTAKHVLILKRIAEQYGVPVDVLKGNRRSRYLDRVRAKSYIALSEAGYSLRSIGILFLRPNSNIFRAIRREKLMSSISMQDDEVIALKRYVSDLAGEHSVHKLVRALHIPPWMAYILAILSEAYPSVVYKDQLCSMYDHLQSVLCQKDSEPVIEQNIRKGVSNLRQEMAKSGLPEPVITIPPGGYVLSDDFAEWLDANVMTIVGLSKQGAIRYG